jgi:hypothetical protein
MLTAMKDASDWIGKKANTTAFLLATAEERTAVSWLPLQVDQKQGSAGFVPKNCAGSCNSLW